MANRAEKAILESRLLPFLFICMELWISIHHDARAPSSYERDPSHTQDSQICAGWLFDLSACRITERGTD
jgi:hypothetical protein